MICPCIYESISNASTYWNVDSRKNKHEMYKNKRYGNINLFKDWAEHSYAIPQFYGHTQPLSLHALGLNSD